MSFVLDLNKFAERAKGNIDQVVRGTVMEVGRRIVQKTPVGDAALWKSNPPKGYVGGRARGNWLYGFNSAPSGDVPDIDPSGSVSIDRISSVLNGPVVGVHFIINNLPYAQRLEDGWSTQAPQGIIGLTVIEFHGIVDETVRGLK